MANAFVLALAFALAFAVAWALACVFALAPLIQLGPGRLHFMPNLGTGNMHIQLDSVRQYTGVLHFSSFFTNIRPESVDHLVHHVPPLVRGKARTEI